MFESFRRERPALQLYGKLPLAKDYLRVGASRGRARQLRDWLDAAFSSRASMHGAPSVAWPMRFLLAAGSEDPLVGSAWPSSDTGGERPFPFTMFVERRRKPLVASLDRGPEGLLPIWREIEDCYAEAGRFQDGQSFLSEMRGREVSLGDAAAPEPARLAWDRWVTALWPERGEAGLDAILSSLADAETVRGPIRLPLAVDAPLVPQVQGWWTALATLRIFHSSLLPSVVFPQRSLGEEAPAFCVFFLKELGLAEADWIAGLSGGVRLGPNDYCDAEVCRFGASREPLESGPSLADSLRGRAVEARAKA